MSDKLRSGISVAPVFVDVEIPPAAKFTVIGAQLKNAAKQLELALGDAHDESYPYSASNTARLSPAWGRDPTTGAALSGTQDRPLAIANLARLIGPSANLNPRMLAGDQTIVEDVPVDGIHQFSLRYPPVDTPVFSDTAVFATPQAEGDLLSSGDYHVTSTGKVYCVDASNGGTVTYTANATSMGGGMNYPGATFNVIPDLNQIQSGLYKLDIVDNLDGTYTVTLPLISEQQSNLDGTSATLGSHDINLYKQLTLPSVLVDNYTAGELIPQGFLFLRNNTTNELFTDATYTYVDEDQFTVSSLDLTDALASLDDFSVVTVGVDITTSIDDLRRKLYHSHDRTYGEPFVPVGAISDVIALEGQSGPWAPSEIPGNFAPQYLHRDGWVSGTDENVGDGNIMRGDFVLGSSTEPPGSKQSLTGDSYSLYFGLPSVTIGPRIYLEDATASEGAGRHNLVLTGGAGSGSSARHIVAKTLLEARVADDAFTLYPNTTFYSGDPTASPALNGNIGTPSGTIYAGAGGLLGPINTISGGGSSLTKWEIDADAGADGYETSGWIIPRFHVLHYAAKDVYFSGKETGGASALLANTDYWELSLELPVYVTANNILGFSILVRGPGEVGTPSTQWRSLGMDPRDPQSWSGDKIVGENTSCFITDETDTDPNKLVIRLGSGGTLAQNDFTNSIAGVYVSGSPSDFKPVDIKITLIVAAPGTVLA